MEEEKSKMRKDFSDNYQTRKGKATQDDWELPGHSAFLVIHL